MRAIYVGLGLLLIAGPFVAIDTSYYLSFSKPLLF